MAFEYQAALVRALSPNFEQALTMASPQEAIDLKKAEQQHDEYVHLLEQLIPSVVHIPADSAHPDCCFIEDTATVIGDRAIIHQLGAPSRQGEEQAVKQALLELGLQIDELQDNARADGGDLLYTGHVLLAGLTSRTNQAAIEQLQELYPHMRVHAIKVPNGLHLKSFISQVDDNCLLVSNCKTGVYIAEQIAQKVPEDYHFVFVPDMISANCLRIGKSVIIQAGYPKSEKVIQSYAEELSLDCHLLEMSELIKADGALTCCSIFIPA